MVCEITGWDRLPYSAQDDSLVDKALKEVGLSSLILPECTR